MTNGLFVWQCPQSSPCSWIWFALNSCSACLYGASRLAINVRTDSLCFLWHGRHSTPCFSSQYVQHALHTNGLDASPRTRRHSSLPFLYLSNISLRPFLRSPFLKGILVVNDIATQGHTEGMNCQSRSAQHLRYISSCLWSLSRPFSIGNDFNRASHPFSSHILYKT